MTGPKMTLRTFEYRGYSMQVAYNPPQWQVEIALAVSGLSKLLPEKKIVRGWEEDEVVKRAKARVDEFLESRHSN